MRRSSLPPKKHADEKKRADFAEERAKALEDIRRR